MAQCGASELVLAAGALESFSTSLALVVGARALAHAEPGVLRARSRGAVLLAECLGAMFAAAVTAREATDVQTGRWALGVAMLLALANFELWFSRKAEGDPSNSKVQALLAAGIAAHTCLVFIVFGHVFAECVSAVAVSACTGAAGAAALLVLPLGVLPPRGATTQSGNADASADASGPTEDKTAQPMPDLKLAAEPEPAAEAKPAKVVVRKIETAAEAETDEKPGAAAGAKPAVESPSALHENIAKKGANSYYFAHAKTPTAENINKGGGPVRIQQEGAPEAELPTKKLVTIRQYSFSDGSKSVSVYIDVTSMQAAAGDEVTYEVEHTATSVRLVVAGSHVLQVVKLQHEIETVKVKLNSSKERLTLSLKKKDPSLKWSALVG